MEYPFEIPNKPDRPSNNAQEDYEILVLKTLIKGLFAKIQPPLFGMSDMSVSTDDIDLQDMLRLIDRLLKTIQLLHRMAGKKEDPAPQSGSSDIVLGEDKTILCAYKNKIVPEGLNT